MIVDILKSHCRRHLVNCGQHCASSVSSKEPHQPYAAFLCVYGPRVSTDVIKCPLHGRPLNHFTLDGDRQLVGNDFRLRFVSNEFNRTQYAPFECF